MSFHQMSKAAFCIHPQVSSITSCYIYQATLQSFVALWDGTQTILELHVPWLKVHSVPCTPPPPHFVLQTRIKASRATFMGHPVATFKINVPNNEHYVEGTCWKNVLCVEKMKITLSEGFLLHELKYICYSCKKQQRNA